MCLERATSQQHAVAQPYCRQREDTVVVPARCCCVHVWTVHAAVDGGLTVTPNSSSPDSEEVGTRLQAARWTQATSRSVLHARRQRTRAAAYLNTQALLPVNGTAVKPKSIRLRRQFWQPARSTLYPGASIINTHHAERKHSQQSTPARCPF